MSKLPLETFLASIQEQYKDAPPHIVASIWETLERLVEFATHEQPDPSDVDPEDDVAEASSLMVIDQSHMMKRDVKWYGLSSGDDDTVGSTRSTRKRGVCYHHTAVRRGFGVKEPVLKLLTPKVLNGDYSGIVMPGSLLHVSGPKAITPIVAAYCARFRGDMPASLRARDPDTGLEIKYGESYHWVFSEKHKLLLHNLPDRLVSWHGNGANNWYLGFAWDGDSRYDIPNPYDIMEALGVVYDTDPEMDTITTHSQWTNKPHDPDAWHIANVILPFARKRNLKVDLDFATNGGQSMNLILGRPKGSPL